MSNIAHTTPILVGCGDITDTTTAPEAARSPFDLMAEAGRRALADTGQPGATAPAIDTVAVARLFADSSLRYESPLGTSTNPPGSVAERLRLNAGRLIYSHVGGNTPQSLVNRFAESIARGEMGTALIVGGEALRTQLGVRRAGLGVSWAEDPGGSPELIGTNRAGWSEDEARHGLNGAIAFYPLFENALRAARSRSIEAHMQAMGKLMAGFARTAARNPLATRRDGHSARRLAQVDGSNRWIGFPYPRLMNANVFVDQAAALVMTSVGKARELGIPQTRWIFLHGCADCQEQWYVTRRDELHTCPAIAMGAGQALDMADIGIADVGFFDLYSCFPSAVEIACRELGLSEDDPRGLTVTGGLPFFGGPGNNYVTHSIAQMMRTLRAAPGTFGLVSGNGYYLTKHAFGVYSTVPVAGPWQRAQPAGLQSVIDVRPEAPWTPTPHGPAVIETYTVMHAREGPERGIVIARESGTGRRFVANTRADTATLLDLRDRESLGRRGSVRQVDDRNVFELD